MRPVLLTVLLAAAACRSTDKLTSDETIDTAGSTTDADGDGYDSSEDCDDNNSLVHPDAAELCDGADNNCNGLIDEDVTTTFFADEDGDGFGDNSQTEEACEAPVGTVPNGNDCDDSDPDSYPGAPERCDGVDNDCDGDIDEDVTTTFYADTDADGYGDPAASVEDCDPDAGYVADATDCDDTDAASFPGGTEVCDEADNDCDGEIDEDVTTTFYVDADADQYGLADQTTEACVLPTGYAEQPGDCDDTTDTISPDAAEVCNTIDDDCDGDIDEDDAEDAQEWYADDDGDGYGDPDDSTVACDQLTGTVSDSTDCDDDEAAANPGEAEVCDEIDNDCDGDIDEDVTTTFYVDADGDGYGDPDDSTEACSVPSGYVSTADDCDDDEAAANPGEAEVCDDIDNDCDGDTDEDDATDAQEWYADDDSDGYGDTDDSTLSCEEPSGYTSGDGDCDDTDADISPDAAEVCDEIDNDCDGDIDEDDAEDAQEWYADDDGDGYGDIDDIAISCEEPSGFVDNDADCDDSTALASPDGEESCDGLDNDCDGVVDELVCLDVSNVDATLLEDADSAITISSDTTIDTETGYIDGIRSASTGLSDGIYFESVSQSGGPDLGVFVFDGLTISSGVTVTVEGEDGLVILSTGDVEIAGALDASGAAGTDGLTTSGPRSGGGGVAAGSDGGSGSTNAASGATDGSGTGAGSVGVAGIHYGNGGGGGGHCYGGGGGMGDRPSVAGSAGGATAGGAGGYNGGDGGSGGDGGDPWSTDTLTPLTGGSGGGGGLSDTDTNPNGAGGGGGAGGGAIQISVDGLLDISGTVSVTGGDGGAAYGGGGGGGSGGGLLLEALELDISGDLDAAGGSGGDGNQAWSTTATGGSAGGGSSSMAGGGGQTESGGGGGAAGWIYLRYYDALSVTGALSPDTTAACASSAAM